MKSNIFNFICYLILIITLIIVYNICGTYARNGYGYPGYRGYHHHHSFWYFSYYDHYYGSSVRENSVSGSRFSQKGIHGGK